MYVQITVGTPVAVAVAPVVMARVINVLLQWLLALRLEPKANIKSQRRAEPMKKTRIAPRDEEGNTEKKKR